MNSVMVAIWIVKMMYFKSGGGSLTDEEQQVTDLLQAMVRIPSVAAKEGQVADLIEAFLAPELSTGLIKREPVSYTHLTLPTNSLV